MNDLDKRIESAKARRDFWQQQLNSSSVSEKERVALSQHVGHLDSEIASLTCGVVVSAEHVLWSNAWWKQVQHAAVGSLFTAGMARAYGLAGARLRMWAAAGGVAGFVAAVPLTERAYRYTYPR